MKFPFKFGKKAPKENYCIGVDIGGSAVKAVKLKFTKDSVELCDLKIEPVALDLPAVLKKISDAFQVKKVNLSISGNSSILRYISFPKMNEFELKQALKFEAEKHIPFTISEVNLDSHILRQDLPDNKMLVLLAAAKKEVIEQRIKLAEDAELKPSIMDIDSIALINAFNFNYPLEKSADEKEKTEAKTVAILNIGASLTNLNILEGGMPRLSRDIHFAGNNFTQKIADMLGMDFSQAEALKITPENTSVEKVTIAVDSILSGLAIEVRTSFDYYETQSASSVTKIYLSGGGILFKGLSEKLANLLGIEVEVWDPLKRIPLAPGLAQVPQEIFVRMGVAAGLALRQEK
jgi:type IV pilus assembly protein PilM